MYFEGAKRQGMCAQGVCTRALCDCSSVSIRLISLASNRRLDCFWAAIWALRFCMIVSLLIGFLALRTGRAAVCARRVVGALLEQHKERNREVRGNVMTRIMFYTHYPTPSSPITDVSKTEQHEEKDQVDNRWNEHHRTRAVKYYARSSL